MFICVWQTHTYTQTHKYPKKFVQNRFSYSKMPQETFHVKYFSHATTIFFGAKCNLIQLTWVWDNGKLTTSIHCGKFSFRPFQENLFFLFIKNWLKLLSQLNSLSFTSKHWLIANILIKISLSFKCTIACNHKCSKFS